VDVDLYGCIEVRGARENNLRDVSLDIPKRRLTVVTGVSGSGKSSLVFDTIAAESRRLINETYTPFVQSFLPHYGRPDVDSVENLSAAIVVDQARMGSNARSTVGTATDASALLRVLFSRLGEPRVWPATALSFNDPSGMCPACEGLGRSSTVDLDALLDLDKSLDEGPISFPNFAVDSWYWTIIARSGFFDPAKKLRDYTDEERDRLLNSGEVKVKNGSFSSTFEGLLPKLRRLYLSKEPAELQPHLRRAVERVTTSGPCPECAGSRLNEAGRNCRIDGISIADCAAMQVDDLLAVIGRWAEGRTPAGNPAGGAGSTAGGAGTTASGAPGSTAGGTANVQQVLRSLLGCLGDLVHIGLGTSPWTGPPRACPAASRSGSGWCATSVRP
jgi:excinuclease UvrABC ATPase subunit